MSVYWQVLISVAMQDIRDLFYLTVRSASYIYIYFSFLEVLIFFSFVTTAGVLTAVPDISFELVVFSIDL